jgi:sugar phosphate isomerase/epimerase
MFQLGIISDEVSQDIGAVVRVAAEFGLAAVEIRSVNNKPPQALTDADVADIRRHLDTAGLVVCGIATPFFKCDMDNPQEREEHLDILRRCVRLAKRLDTNLLRCFAFWNTGKTAARWNEIVEAFDEPLRIAEGEGVVLGMENESSTSLATAALTRRFVEEIDRPCVRAIWDPANELYADGGVTPYPDGYETLRDVLVHGHMKDAAPNEEGEMVSVPVGEGRIDWPGQFQRYVDDGYSGYLCLETHWRPQAALSHDLLNRPGGAAFSEAGEEASRYCLARIRDMLSALRTE